MEKAHRSKLSVKFKRQLLNKRVICLGSLVCTTPWIGTGAVQARTPYLPHAPSRAAMNFVLLPGRTEPQLFADFVAALGPEIEVIVASYPADKPLAYAELEARVRAMLPTDRNYFLLGESFSSPIAIAIAASAPPGLRGLLLCCSFARNPCPCRRTAPRGVPVAVAAAELVFPLGFSTPRLCALAGAVAVAPVCCATRVRRWR
jgi:pimeloyl-ACP methyl ester carboxylesterase